MREEGGEARKGEMGERKEGDKEREGRKEKWNKGNVMKGEEGGNERG